MNQVIDNILLKINNHDDVKNSVLSKTEKWKNSHYETLSQIINHNLTNKIELNSELFFTLGNSVSAITLKRLYKKEIKPSAHTDLRFRKTLDKLCVFLDYNVTEMNGVFINAKAFNQPLNKWNTSNVTRMNEMFLGASLFNQNISNWNTSSVTLMQTIFQNATASNQNIGNWNTSSVTNMVNMFSGASSFNQNLGNWNLSSLQYASSTFFNSGMNCQNYDSTLFGWNLNPATPSNISLNMVTPLVYSHPAAVAARQSLMTNKGWSFLGDSYNGECQSILSTNEDFLTNDINIYPSPATDFIKVKNVKLSESFIFLMQAQKLSFKENSIAAKLMLEL